MWTSLSIRSEFTKGSTSPNRVAYITINRPEARNAIENAAFGLTEVRLGIIPAAGGTWRLPRAVPLAKAMEIVLKADPNKRRRGLSHRAGEQSSAVG